MRGTLRIGCSFVFLVGIIPADAGNTEGKRWKNTGTKDHPRGCGEHPPVSVSKREREGSSPRMRGTPPGVNHQARARRIIPADAGNTSDELDINLATKDHPRGCGEHASGSTSSREDCGSSPRMRGTHRHFRVLARPVGIIPADAGNTTPAVRSLSNPRDHPRGCGEHCIALPVMSTGSGSSPRMRGTHGIISCVS